MFTAILLDLNFLREVLILCAVLVLLVQLMLLLVALLGIRRWWRTRSASDKRYLQQLLALELGPEGVKCLARQVAMRAVELLAEQAGVNLPAGILPCLAEVTAESSKALTVLVAWQLLAPKARPQ